VSAKVFAAASICFVSALRRTDVADVLVIIAAGPLFAAVLGRLFLKEPTPRRTWIASLAVLVGIGVIVSGSVGRGDLVGDLLALAGASCFAGYLTVSRGARPGDITPAIAIGGVGAALVGAVAGADLSIGGGDLLLLSVLGLAILPVSLTLITRATRHLSAAEVSLVALLETFLAPLWVWLAVGEVPAPEVVSGGAVVVAAVAAHTVPTLTERPARAVG
jgi:drug/metabolite transporter (DMT)-like permease